MGTSPVTDDDLRKIRDDLKASLGVMPRAWQIAEAVMKQFNYKMDGSTIRGRFIEMEEALRGGTGVAPAAQVHEAKPERNVVVSVVAATSNPTFKAPNDLMEFVPQASEFDSYVERPTDTRLSIHYDIGPLSGRYKYPLTQGKQGTGKTFSHAHYAFKRQLPFFLFSCYEDFRLAKLFGDKTIVNGTVKFVESLFVRAIQGPSVVLFDEVNAISNANSFDFHALLQNRELFVKDADDGKGKTYRLHKECRIGFAQNPRSAKYIGGNIKPSNFLGRCTFLTYPEFSDKEIFDAMAKKFDKKVSKKDISKFVKYYFGAIKCIDQSGLPLDISIRQLTNVIDLYAHGMKLEDALHDGLIGMLDAVSQPTAKEAFVKLAQACWKEMLPKDMQDNIKEEEEEKAKMTAQNVTVSNVTVTATPAAVQQPSGLTSNAIASILQQKLNDKSLLPQDILKYQELVEYFKKAQTKGNA